MHLEGTNLSHSRVHGHRLGVDDEGGDARLGRARHRRGDVGVLGGHVLRVARKD